MRYLLFFVLFMSELSLAMDDLDFDKLFSKDTNKQQKIFNIEQDEYQDSIDANRNKYGNLQNEQAKKIGNFMSKITSTTSKSSRGSSYSAKYGCKFYCTGSFDMRRSSEFHVNTSHTNSSDAQDYVKKQYKRTCSKYPFYSGGGGSASVGFPRCETYYYK